jgi:hypothetical protein
LNSILPCYVIHSETGIIEFHKELGRVTFWSYPIIVLPCTFILVAILIGLRKRLEKVANLHSKEMPIAMQTKSNKTSQKEG